MRTPESDYRIVNELRHLDPFSVATCLSLRSIARSENYSPLEVSELLEEYRQVSKANVGSVGFEDYPLWESRSEQTQEKIRKTKIVEFLRHIERKMIA